MNTPAHMALSLAVFGRRAGPAEATAILVGAILPDLFLLLGFGLGIRALLPMVPVFNSVPVWAVLLLAGISARRNLLVLLSASALIHIALDLPLHANDARPHFWPLTDWVFPARYPSGMRIITGCCSVRWRD